MPGRQLLMTPSSTVYEYDGSLAGLYQCIYESLSTCRMPLSILSDAQSQCSLLPPLRIHTNTAQAIRVRNAIASGISPRALELSEHAFLTCLQEKEMSILRFVAHGFAQGARTTDDLTHPAVATLLKAETHLLREAHLLTGFVRFADYGGILAASISPKNFVLPLLAPHFTDRFPEESFCIYDRTHHTALLYAEGKAELVDAQMADHTSVSAEELHYQALWKRFHQAIGIKERENHKLRMTHMPKRYWGNMTEMQTSSQVPFTIFAKNPQCRQP